MSLAEPIRLTGRCGAPGGSGLALLFMAYQAAQHLRRREH